MTQSNVDVHQETIHFVKKNDSTQADDRWSKIAISDLFNMPFNDLIFMAHKVHRESFDPNAVQLSTLLSIKTGGCAEDCGYCPQSARYSTDVENTPILSIDEVIESAKAAKSAGASRFCMGAAWRSPHDRDIPAVSAMIREVKALGLETCMTLGMLSEEQSEKLADAGLDYYNHNLDTSKEFYGEVITTSTFQDRLNTLANVRNSGMKVCAGGIVGMGEEQQDRAGLLMALANLPVHPESVPINMLVKVAGTPMADQADLDPFEFIRTIAVARLMMPKSYVRLSAGREDMNEQMQAMAFMAGANSIFYCDKLLTTPNPKANTDMQLFERLGIKPEEYQADKDSLQHEEDLHRAINEHKNDALFYSAS
jgi:biotin synthase